MKQTLTHITQTLSRHEADNKQAFILGSFKFCQTLLKFPSSDLGIKQTLADTKQALIKHSADSTQTLSRHEADTKQTLADTIKSYKTLKPSSFVTLAVAPAVITMAATPNPLLALGVCVVCV